MITFQIIGFIAACVFLVVSGSFVVRSLIKIAAYLNLSDFVVGSIIMALATSMPELFVGITSAINEVPTLALGDIMGSNIVDVTLVLGLVVILARGIQVKGKIAIKDAYLAVFISVIPILLMLDRNLSRVDGIILLIIYSIFVFRLWSQRKRFKKCSDNVTRKEFIKNVIIFIVGVAFLLLSANFIVRFGTDMALGFGVPLILIGIIFIAIGTDLPELVFEIRAVTIKREGMALGDSMGSVVTQGTLVLGLVGIISPFTINNFMVFGIAAVFLIVALAILIFCLRTKKTLSWKEGMILIMLYIFFIIAELSFR